MSIIEKINERLTIDEVLTFLPGLKQKGHDWEGKCPTGHDSKSGKSFKINTIDPTFNCFNCGVRGSYIHLIELIKFGRSSAGEGGTHTFKDTIKFLADRYRLSNEQSEYTQKESVFDIIDWAIADYHEQLSTHHPELFAVIKNKWGLDKDFINRERWGYGHSCPSVRMSEFWTRAELLSTGLFNETSRSKTGVFHIYQGRIIIPYNNKGRVRYTIGRKTKATKDWGDGKEAPKYFKQYIHRETRPYVSECIKNEIIYCNRDYHEVVITEGITDYLAAKMHSLNAVSAVTTSFKKVEYEKVVNFCKKFKTVYIANDNDENEAGQKGTKSISEMLIDAGINPFVILLPRTAGEDKADFAGYVKNSGIEDLNKLKRESVTYIEFLINKIPKDVDKSVLLDRLSPIIKTLSKQPKEMVEIFILDKIKTRFKLASMKNLLKKIKDSVEESTSQLEFQNPKDHIKKNTQEIFDDNANNIKMVSSGQDYQKGILYYTITRPYQATDKHGIVKIINKLFVVSSDKKITEVQDYQVISDGFALSRKSSPDFRCEYWSFKGSAYSIENYIKGVVKIDPAVLYQRIKKFVQKYVYFKEEYEATFCAVAIMTSPLFMVFNAIGYIHLWAERQSGKTTMLEIFQMLGFNTRLASSISSAALYRSIELFRPLLLVDEAEDLNQSARARENRPSEKLELLKSGYKKSGSASRCEGQDNTVVTYSNYCLKVFASIKTIDTTLWDRMIVIEMKRAKEGNKIEELIEARVIDETNEIRDMLYCYALEHCGEINKNYLTNLECKKDELVKNKVTFRSKELFTPYFCVAMLIDQYEPDAKTFNGLLEKALRSIETKETFRGDSKSMEIVEKLYQWTKRVQNSEIISMTMLYDMDIYMRKGITDYFIKEVLKSEENEDDFHYMNYQKLKQTLRKFDVIDKDCEFKSYSFSGKRGAALMLSEERMIESLITYKNDFDEEVLKDILAHKKRTGMTVKDEDVTFDLEEAGVD